MSTVYIIVVNWNGWRDTVECLESLLLLDYDDFKVVVCDNGSTDTSMAELRRWFQSRMQQGLIDWQELSRGGAERADGISKIKVTLVDNAENLGFGGGSNVGLRYALACGDADYCWLLNNDTVVDSMALARLVERMNQPDRPCMCGSTIRDYYNRSKIQALGGAVYFKWLGIAWHLGRTVSGEELPDPLTVEKRMDYVVGASLMVSSNYLREIGLIAEGYFLYFEEIDWMTRGAGRYHPAYAPLSVVYHKVGASVGTATNPAIKSYQSDYYSLRNRIYFSRRHYPHVLPVIYLVLLGELVVRAVMGKWDRVRMISQLICNGGRETTSS